MQRTNTNKCRSSHKKGPAKDTAPRRFFNCSDFTVSNTNIKKEVYNKVVGRALTSLPPKFASKATSVNVSRAKSFKITEPENAKRHTCTAQLLGELCVIVKAVASLKFSFVHDHNFASTKHKAKHKKRV